MNLPFTQRTQAALQAAQEQARASQHPETTPTHLALALLAEPAGATAAILQRLGVDAAALGAELATGLTKLPRVTGAAPEGGPPPSRELAATFERATADARRRVSSRWCPITARRRTARGPTARIR